MLSYNYSLWESFYGREDAFLKRLHISCRRLFALLAAIQGSSIHVFFSWYVLIEVMMCLLVGCYIVRARDHLNITVPAHQIYRILLLF